MVVQRRRGRASAGLSALGRAFRCARLRDPGRYGQRFLLHKLRRARMPHSREVRHARAIRRIARFVLPLLTRGEQLRASIVSSAVAGALLWLALTVGGPIAWSAKPAISTKVLLRTTLSGAETKEVIIASAEFPPGSTTGRHTHPGDEYATVLAGTLEILVEARASKRVS